MTVRRPVAPRSGGELRRERPSRWAVVFKDRPKRYLLLTGFALVFVLYNVHHWWGSPGDDWSSIWVAAAMVAGGVVNHLYQVDPQHYTLVADPQTWMHFAHITGRLSLGHPYVQEPGLAYILSPLAGPGSWGRSLHVLLLLNVVCLLGTVWLVGRTWAPSLLEPVPFAVVLMVLSVSEPVRNALWLGQTTPIIVFLTIAAVALAARHPILAGLLLALPVSVKITPLVIGLYWLVDRRRWRAIIGLVAGVAVLAIVQVGFISGHVISAYTTTLRYVEHITTTGFDNQSLPAWLMTFNENQPLGTYPTRSLPQWVSLLTIAALVVTVAAVLVRAHHLKRQGADPERFATAGLLTASLLFTSLSWVHYYVMLLVPAALLIEAGRTARIRWPYAVVAGLVVLSMQPLAINDAANVATPDSIVRAELLAGFVALVAVLLLPERAAPRLLAAADIGDQQVDAPPRDTPARAHQRRRQPLQATHEVGH